MKGQGCTQVVREKEKGKNGADEREKAKGGGEKREKGQIMVAEDRDGEGEMQSVTNGPKDRLTDRPTDMEGS